MCVWWCLKTTNQGINNNKIDELNKLKRIPPYFGITEMKNKNNIEI